MKKCRLLLAGLVLLPVMLPAQMRELSFYEVRPRTKPIVIDGKIDKDEWKGVLVHDSYYEYWIGNPGPGALKTELRLAYDQIGLYMAVTNYDDNIPRLKRTITENDNPNLWADDCGEFYFDPAADGIGYTKFIINANGAKYDMRRQDAAVYLHDWSGSSWKAAVSIGKDVWHIEAFFPWEDLNGVGKPGSVWQFCHARFSWTKGFRGMVNSPGGNYNNTNSFGYIYFSDGKTLLDPMKIGHILAGKASAPWCVPCGQLLVSYNGTSLKTDDLADLLKQERKKCRYLLMELEALQPSGEIAGKTDNIRKFLAGAKKKNIMTAYKMYRSATEQLFLLKWNLLLKRNFN